MANIIQRPYAGTWRLNNTKLVRHTPDCLVFINGDLSIPGCKVEDGKINLQPFIKGISVDASTEPGGHSGNIQFSIPRVYGESLNLDGRSVLRPSLEVHIYMRGYFPVKGLYDHLPPDQAELPAVNASDPELKYSVITRRSIKGFPTYPYYHVFHGVVTQVNSDYADGFYSGTMAVASMLHFWQYQVITTNGSAFGSRPRNSNVKMSLIGHNLAGMSPYGIIYMLYKDTAGAAAGVGFALSGKTNKDSLSAVTGQSLYSMSLLYWEQRFKQTMYSLRMHGTNGRLFNGVQQAFLGTARSRDIKRIIKGSQFADTTKLHRGMDPVGAPAATKLKELRAKEISNLIAGRVVGQIGLTGNGLDIAYAARSSEQGFSVNVLDAQAYVSDISNWGNVNLFESQYETKLDVANKVREITGFEFYQDVDGDLVFKPPFYNMDTSNSRVYRIEDIDIISFNTIQKEPNATAVIMKGSQFKNLAGTGLDNEWGVRGEYVDYRLVAQFGWRHHNMDISYFNNPRSMFYAAVNKLDLLNIDTNAASLTIPIRPELRPGYPIYIPFIDSYYYLTAFSHSFQFGSQCTTACTLTARRSKFYAPGRPDETGIGKITLDNPYNPALPLKILDGEGLPRLSGFPNVVMALDPERLNPQFSILGLSIADVSTSNRAFFDQLIERIQQADVGILKLDSEIAALGDGRARFEGPFSFQQEGEKGTTVEISVNSEEFIRAFETELKQIEQKRDELAELEESIIEARLEGTLTDEFIAKTNGKITEASNSILQFGQAENHATGVLIKFFNSVFSANNAAQSRENIEGAKDGPSTVNYLEILSDRKSNFVATSIPGYYRYYSASHPDPAFQGMRELRVADMTQSRVLPDGQTTESRDPVDLKDNPIARLNSPTSVVGYLPESTRTDTEGGEGKSVPEARLGTISVVNGIRLAQARGNPPRVVPTHLIETISFASVDVSKSATFIASKNLEGFSISKAKDQTLIRSAIAAVIYLRVTSERSFDELLEETIAETYANVFDDINNDINSESGFSFVDNGGRTRDISEFNLGYTEAPGVEGSSTSEGINFPIGPLSTQQRRRGLSPAKGALPDDNASSSVGLRDLTVGQAISLPSRSKNKSLNVANKVFFTFSKDQGATARILGSNVGIKSTKQNRSKLRRIAFYYAKFIADSLTTSSSNLLGIVSEQDAPRMASFLNAVIVRTTESALEWMSSGRGKTGLRVNKKALKQIRNFLSTYTPVFPISDEKGYEVFGSYRYGRGIDIGTGGTMQRIYESGNDIMIDVFGRADANIAELFLEALRTREVQERAAEILSDQLSAAEDREFSPDNVDTVSANRGAIAKRNQVDVSRAAAAAAVESLLGSDNPEVRERIDKFLQKRPPPPDGLEPIEGLDISANATGWVNQFANSVATNQDDVFKLAVVNGAFLLRDLGQELETNSRLQFSCRGAEADLLLEAYGRTEFVGVEEVAEGSQPSAFLREQALLESPLYFASRKALQGEIRQFASADGAVLDAFRKLQESGEIVRGGLGGTVQNLLNATEGLESAAQRFAELRRFSGVKSFELQRVGNV